MNKCISIEAKKFEIELNEMGITYNSLKELEKVYLELTEAGKAEVANMLKDADNITPAVRNLLNKDTGVVFDCDGVLCVYELGKKRHMACPDEEWEDYVRNEKPYDKAMPVRQIQRFIKDKGVDDVYVCSKASDFEAEQKKNFVMREYGIPEDHICIVTSKQEKIEFMKKLAKEKYNNREDKVALVEDTVSTLDDVYMESDFLTIHVSSFMSY